MDKPLKKNDPRRIWRSFQRHGLFLLQSLVIASAATGLWYAFYMNEIYFSDKDEPLFVGIVIAVLGVAFSAVVGAVYVAVLEKGKEMSRAMLPFDAEAFMRLRDERLPTSVYLLLGTLSVSLIGMLMVFNYHGAWLGASAVFVTTCAIWMFYFGARQLDNPAASPWFAERIPQEFKTADVDEWFKKHGRKTAA